MLTKVQNIFNTKFHTNQSPEKKGSYGNGSLRTPQTLKEWLTTSESEQLLNCISWTQAVNLSHQSFSQAFPLEKSKFSKFSLLQLQHKMSLNNRQLKIFFEVVFQKQNTVPYLLKPLVELPLAWRYTITSTNKLTPQQWHELLLCVTTRGLFWVA